MLRQRITGDPVADAGNFYFIGVPSGSSQLEKYSNPDEARAFIYEVTERKDLVIGDFTWFSAFRFVFACYIHRNKTKPAEFPKDLI